MAEKNFKLPDVDKMLGGSPKPGKETIPVPSLPVTAGGGINTKQIVIASGAVLVAAIIFVIIKNYVSRMLVANYKKSPRSGDMAGWSLFCVLLIAAVAVAMGILDSTKLLSLPYLIPLSLAMLTSLIMFLVALFAKR